jgi:hypothetical protein
MSDIAKSLLIVMTGLFVFIVLHHYLGANSIISIAIVVIVITILTILPDIFHKDL